MTIESAALLDVTYENVLRNRGEEDKIYYSPEVIEVANMVLKLFGHKNNIGQKIDEIHLTLAEDSHLTCSIKTSDGDVVGGHYEFSKDLTVLLEDIRMVRMKEDTLKTVKHLLSKYCDCEPDGSRITLKH